MHMLVQVDLRDSTWGNKMSAGTPGLRASQTLALSTRSLDVLSCFAAELSAEDAANLHLQEQLALSDSDLCSIPYSLSRSELGLLLVELHQAARLQQSGHR